MRYILLCLLCAQPIVGDISFIASGNVLAAEEVHVYSHRHYPLDKELYAEFERTEGIEVTVLQAKADELIERIAAEGERTPADLLITVDASRLIRAQQRGLLQAVTSSQLRDQVPAALRDEDGYWYALTTRARVIIYNPARRVGRPVATYSDLARRVWDDRLVMRTSRHGYNISLLAALIANYGDATARAWVNGVAANLARAPSGNDRDQLRAVARGEADATIVNSYYLALFLNSEGRDREYARGLAVSFPNQDDEGAHINISGAAVVAASDNRDGAIKLLEYLSSAPVQRTFAAANFEYPVHPDVDPAPTIAAWGEPKFDYASITKTDRYWETAVRIFDASQWR